MSCINIPDKQMPNQTMEESLRARKDAMEDQIDYQFIQRIIQEVTQSCALNLPIPASAIPPLIIQAAQFFWQNDDQAVERRWFCLPNSEFQKCGLNNMAQLPPQIVSVVGVYKTAPHYNFGILGDFSLERMIINSSAMASGMGGSLTNVFGSGTGYNLTDITAALYELSTYKAMFDVPVTYDYNEFSNVLEIQGALNNNDLVLDVYKRVKIQDLYKNYYFFRYCVCLTLRAMGTIMGTYEFKLPGGVTLNYQNFRDAANEEIQQIVDWINQNHAVDYFIMSETI